MGRMSAATAAASDNSLLQRSPSLRCAAKIACLLYFWTSATCRVLSGRSGTTLARLAQAWLNFADALLLLPHRPVEGVCNLRSQSKHASAFLDDCLSLSIGVLHALPKSCNIFMGYNTSLGSLGHLQHVTVLGAFILRMTRSTFLKARLQLKRCCLYRDVLWMTCSAGDHSLSLGSWLW